MCSSDLKYTVDDHAPDVEVSTAASVEVGCTSVAKRRAGDDIVSVDKGEAHVLIWLLAFVKTTRMYRLTQTHVHPISQAEHKFITLRVRWVCEAL